MSSQPRDRIIRRVSRPVTAAPSVTERLREATDEHATVSRTDVRTVAAQTNLPVAAVAGAASFYADLALPQRKSHHVRVCRGTACLVARRGVGPQLPDRADTSVQQVYCVGFCYAAPALLDGAEPRTGPEGRHGPPIPHTCAAPVPIVLAGLSGSASPWQVWPDVVARARPDDITTEVAVSGLRGRGGAGFPVAEKWRAARGNSAPRYVVANGDEGDPGSYCDRLLMEGDPHRVLEGLALCGFAVGARRGMVLVRSEYPAAVEIVGQAVEQARAAGHLGMNVHGSGVDFDITVHEGAGSYVAGEETALLRSLHGLRGGVQARPPYPTECGFAGRPTVVHNTETLAAIPWIVHNGGSAYARYGTSIETGTKLLSLSAGFAKPGVYEVELATPLRHVIEQLGGGLRDGRRLRAVQVGGPLGGFLGPDDLDTALTRAGLAARGVALGHGGLVAVDDGVSAAALLRHLWEFAAAESCGGCAPCRVGTTRGLEMSADPRQTVKDYPRLLDIIGAGSLCAFGSGVADAIRSLLRVYADELGGSAP